MNKVLSMRNAKLVFQFLQKHFGSRPAYNNKRSNHRTLKWYEYRLTILYAAKKELDKLYPGCVELCWPSGPRPKGTPLLPCGLLIRVPLDFSVPAQAKRKPDWHDVAIGDLVRISINGTDTIVLVVGVPGKQPVLYGYPHDEFTVLRPQRDEMQQVRVSVKQYLGTVAYASGLLAFMRSYQGKRGS